MAYSNVVCPVITCVRAHLDVRHGGYIVVDYAPDKDIYIKVYMPEIHEVLTVEEKNPEPTPRVEEATILLVEDDAIVLFVNKTRLERLGYKVITATSGEMALD
ncbi:MAG: hypothetical protein NT106_15300, partial [Candidatus Sumerlaeota bacterium]|nr:hypothetical protein [Candidatus Sumerlaeota bacterium]